MLEAYSVRRSASWYWREVSGALWLGLREALQKNLLPLAREMVAEVLRSDHPQAEVAVLLASEPIACDTADRQFRAAS